jgi:hypothetical protein
MAEMIDDAEQIVGRERRGRFRIMTRPAMLE